MSSLNASRIDKPVALLWGCELTDQNKTASFKVEVEEYEQQQALKARPGSVSTGKFDHRLVLNTICMGEKAKDEFHIVEILPKEDEKDQKPVAIASLKPSILPMATLVGLELTPPITFNLKAGAGPVYISGQHIALEADTWAEEEEIEEEAEEEEEEEISPVKPSKRQATQKKTGPAKKKKMDEEEPEEMESEEDTKKGKPAAKGRKPAGKK
ncbi:nucleoplasmin-2 isoform X2 [Ambystoma mexicanum]|uniref:nucleoplasmin-2 isoform X2 n=1 Tax=Ambystoma mexicanum TaxID=8296 RepID=UPI0037E9A193